MFLPWMILESLRIYARFNANTTITIVAITDPLLSLAIFTSVMQNATFHLYAAGQPLHIKAMVYVGLTLAHLKLTGSGYVGFLSSKAFNSVFDSTTSLRKFTNMLIMWSKLYVG
jgi:hypothetical protein